MAQTTTEATTQGASAAKRWLDAGLAAELASPSGTGKRPEDGFPGDRDYGRHTYALTFTVADGRIIVNSIEGTPQCMVEVHDSRGMLASFVVKKEDFQRLGKALSAVDGVFRK